MTLLEQKERCAEIAKEIQELESQLRTLRTEAEPMLEAIAEEAAPFKVGDIVQRPKRHGWKWDAPLRTLRVRIRRIGGNGRIFGNQILKNGSMGRDVEIHSWDVKQFTIEPPTAAEKK